MGRIAGSSINKASGGWGIFIMISALILPMIFIWKALRSAFLKLENNVQEVERKVAENKNCNIKSAYSLDDSARVYAHLIPELHSHFPDCVLEDLDDGRYKSGNNINFVNRGTLISVRASEKNLKSNKKIFDFNSDETGLAVGFRDDVVDGLSLRHLEFISKEDKWHYYRIKSSEDIRLLQV